MAARARNVSLKYNVIAENLRRAPRPTSISFRGKMMKDPMVCSFGNRHFRKYTVPYAVSVSVSVSVRLWLSVSVAVSLGGAILWPFFYGVGLWEKAIDLCRFAPFSIPWCFARTVPPSDTGYLWYLISYYLELDLFSYRYSLFNKLRILDQKGKPAQVSRMSLISDEAFWGGLSPSWGFFSLCIAITGKRTKIALISLCTSCWWRHYCFYAW